MAEQHPSYPSHLHGDDAGGTDDPSATGGTSGRNPHASANRWRHQESPAFARHAAATAAGGHGGGGGGSDGGSGGGGNSVRDLTDFLNASRITPAEAAAAAAGGGASAAAKEPGKGSPGAGSTPKFTPIVVPASANGQADGVQGAPADGKEIVVGPLLNYRRMEDGRWIGSALIVTRGGGKTQPFVPTLLLGPAEGGADKGAAKTTTATAIGPGAAGADGGPSANGAGSAVAPGGHLQEVQGVCLYSDPRNTFWRFDLAVPVRETESRWQYSLPDMRYASATKPRTSYFFVPAITESMRILFYSCNGFSVGTDEDAWSGPALWNDVIRCHDKAPFHVMIGGGDQIYNDSIRVAGPLREWTAIGNPKKRREFPFPETLRQQCDDFYLNNYITWYSTEPFASANGQIPQLNIWDDHDIIDGFGSYVNEFMNCDVFRGIGGTAHKYYMLFQHHLPPPVSTFTSDAPRTADSHAPVPAQLVDTYVAPRIIEPNYIIGTKPGPYVAEHSHNMYCRLGARMAFLGIDARTERTRHQVNYPETYELIFDRLATEFRAAAAAGEPITHLILLLGIPIAYPRLTWLENVFNSPVMGPVKFMNRRFGLGGGFFNYFDGSVDLLDDLDDHYTARTHKKERNWLVERLQAVSAEFSVRITILGGDVHLAALGRFYANPELNVPSEHDYRLMINVVSSAITNKPPPAAVANLLARRNKIHHLNGSTDETLFKFFNKDPGTSTKTAGHNQVTMPSRNFAVITENSPNNPASESERSRAPAREADGAPPATPNVAASTHSRSSSRFRRRSASRRRGNGTNGSADGAAQNGLPPGSSNSASVPKASSPTGRSGHHALHAGEEGAGTEHKAAGELHGKGNDGSLDVAIRVEIDQHDPQGRTEAYGLSIPALSYSGPPPVPRVPHHFRTSRPNTGHRSTTTASS